LLGVTDVAAGALDAEPEGEAQERQGADVAERPGLLRVFLLVYVAIVLGGFLATVALAAPSFLGVASADTLSETALPFALETRYAVVADLAVGVVALWAVTVSVRYWLQTFVADTPAWTWTAATLFGAGALASLTFVSAAGATALAAGAMRWTAYRADGTPRAEPFTLRPSRAWGVAITGLVPVLAIGAATGYAIYHPFAGEAGGPVLKLAAGTTPVYVVGPPITNRGGIPVKVLGIEPGVEHGYALHLTNVELLPTLGDLGRRAPFRPFTLGSDDATLSSLALEISRSGCRPGSSGRIESLRVRYELGGVRTMLVRLGHPIELIC
jgi:hypothetical protein